MSWVEGCQLVKAADLESDEYDPVLFKKAYCCECGKEVVGAVKRGSEIYGNRPNLEKTFFIVCPHCHEYTSNISGEHPTIPSKKIREFRYLAHRLMEDERKDSSFKHRYYSFMNRKMGYNFHWGTVRDTDTAQKAFNLTMSFMDEEEDE